MSKRSFYRHSLLLCSLLLTQSVANAEDFSDLVPSVDPYPLEPAEIPSVEFQPISVGSENKEFLPAWIGARVNGALSRFSLPPQTITVEGGTRGTAPQVNLCAVNSTTHNTQPITNICVVSGVIVEGN